MSTPGSSSSTPVSTPDWPALAARLTKVLHLAAPPVALTFRSVADRSPGHPAPAAESGLPPAPANEHGRTGAVPAGCVFWIQGAQAPVTTYAADHANCSVGSLTHGFRTLDEVAANDDVQALLEAGWVGHDDVVTLPVVAERTESVHYAPLGSVTETPDVVLIRTNARGLMTVKDAVPDLPVEGKPQCHIVAMAQQGRVAASVGCALSRARTGIRADEATCVFPGSLLPELIDRIEHHARLDARMAQYAGADAQRFA